MLSILTFCMIYIDGLLGMEAYDTLKRIVSYLETNWRQHYSGICGYVKSMVSIMKIQATHGYIQGS